MKNGIISTALACLVVLGCQQKAEVIDHRAACDVKTSQWYDSQAKSKDSLPELRQRHKVMAARANYHGGIAQMTTVTGEEKAQAQSKALDCLRELRWTAETIKKLE